MQRRERIQRVAEGLSELARGNYSHRVIMPGDDECACMADDLNRLADNVQREQEDALACDASRRQLLADISHDLRTPITSIAGYVDALQRGLGDEPERFLAVLAQKTGELAQLTDDLFYAARLDAGDLELKRQPVDLAESLRRSVLGFEAQLAGRGVSVRVAVPERACMIEGDPSALARILSNLIANALHHGTEMTSFAVEMGDGREGGDAATGPAGAYTVRIMNDGAELPADAEHLFERGAAGAAGGTGLGLSIARALAQRMGGSVTVAASPAAQRVTFLLTLPAAPPA